MDFVLGRTMGGVLGGGLKVYVEKKSCVSLPLIKF